MALQGTLRELTEMALSCVQQEYPYYVGVVLRSADDVELPAQQTPVFNGAFDWHSAVHGHWTLVRALHVDPDRTNLGKEHAAEIEAYLDRALNPEDLAQEVAYAEARPGFEVP